MRESEELREIAVYSSLSQLALHDEYSSKPSKSNKYGSSSSSGSTLQVNSNRYIASESKRMLSSSSLDDSRFGETTAIGKTIAAEAESTAMTMGSRSSTGDMNSIPDVHSADYSEFYRRSSDGSDNDFAGGIAIVSNKNGVYEL